MQLIAFIILLGIPIYFFYSVYTFIKLRIIIHRTKDEIDPFNYKRERTKTNVNLIVSIILLCSLIYFIKVCIGVNADFF